MSLAKGKRLIYTRHGNRNRIARGIDEAEIVRTIEDPNLETRAKSPGCRRAERRFGRKRKVGVIYREDSAEIRVITTWRN